MEPTKVVLGYRDGYLAEGFTLDFFPNKDRFHLILANKSSAPAIEVSMKDLKAIFMVRDFNGDPQYTERKNYLEGEKPSGQKIEVTFTDGEVMVGSTLGYDTKRSGFSLFPADLCRSQEQQHKGICRLLLRPKSPPSLMGGFYMKAFFGLLFCCLMVIGIYSWITNSTDRL